MAAEPGSNVELRDVLLVSDGGTVTVGSPSVPDAVVIAEVVEHGKGKKVVNFKYKAKVRYRRKRGHRQGFTKLTVREIRIGGVSSAATDVAPRRRGRARTETEAPVAAEEETPLAVAEPVVEAAVEETPAPARRRRRTSSETSGETQE
jgi:large subunit ribosomal protein L21